MDKTAAHSVSGMCRAWHLVGTNHSGVSCFDNTPPLFFFPPPPLAPTPLQRVKLEAYRHRPHCTQRRRTLHGYSRRANRLSLGFAHRAATPWSCDFQVSFLQFVATYRLSKTGTPRGMSAQPKVGRLERSTGPGGVFRCYAMYLAP